MKTVKKLVLLISFMAFSLAGFAQGEGELDRFASSTMDGQNKVSLYPNPTVDYLQVKIENSNLKDAKILVYNILGNEVEAELREKEDDTYIIDVSNLPAGYYFLAIRDEKAYFRETYKFVKR